MSLLTIPRETYNRILTNAIAGLIDQGLDLTAARALAQEQMDNAFVPDDVTDLREASLDAAEKGIYS